VRGACGVDDADAVTAFAVQRPWAIGALDGALALCDRGAPLRQRLLLMAAILEARPQYCDDFLPRERTAIEAAAVALRVVRAGLLAIGGFALVAMVRRTYAP
jgi:hypothetical protein